MCINKVRNVNGQNCIPLREGSTLFTILSQSLRVQMYRQGAVTVVS